MVKRIEQKVKNPSTKKDLIKRVERGEDLKGDERGIYTVDEETGAEPLSVIRLLPHAQYRMDLRSVTVGDVRAALIDFLNRWGNMKLKQHEEYKRKLDRGEKIEWTAQSTKLQIVFQYEGRGRVRVITAFWPGKSDPPLPEEPCLS